MSQSIEEQRDNHLYPFPNLRMVKKLLQEAPTTSGDDEFTHLHYESEVGGESKQYTRTTVHHTTEACNNGLKGLVSILENKINLFSEDWSYDRVVGLRHSFAYWIDFTGALAPKEASLDERLHEHNDVRGMVVELLEMMFKNINHSKSGCQPNPTHATTILK